MLEPEEEPEHFWKTKALNLAGVVMEYDKLVCRLESFNNPETAKLHGILRDLMEDLCRNCTPLNGIVVP